MNRYLDYIFLENLIVTYFVFIQIDKTLKRNIKIILRVISSLIMSLYMTTAYVYVNSFISSFVVKILVVNTCIYILYKPETVIKYVKYILLYFLINILYMGIVIAITVVFKFNLSSIIIKILVYLISYIILNIFNSNLWKLWKTNIKQDNLTYKVSIRGKFFEGFVDTGNTAKNIISGIDIFFMNIKFYNQIITTSDIAQKIELNIKTPYSNECLEGYIIKKVKIYKENMLINEIPKIIVCFSNSEDMFKEYDILINCNTYFDYLEGD